jgi:uncharacterized protein
MPFSLSSIPQLLQNALIRQTQLVITYRGTDITIQMSPDLLEFEYTENLSWECDNMQIELQDRDGKWIDEWRLQRGADLQVKIRMFNFDRPGEGWQLDCGTAQIDEIEAEGPPRVVRFKCSSVPAKSGINFTKRWTTWSGSTLRGIAQTIATLYKMDLKWEVKEDFSITAVQQDYQTDLEFLAEECRKFAYA